MNSLTKKFVSSLVLVMLLGISITQILMVSADQTADLDSVLTFLEDVVNLDLSEYDITLVGTTVSNPADLGGITQITGKYVLKSKTSNFTVLFTFSGNNLTWCYLSSVKGELHYKSSPSTEIQDNVISFMHKYQTFIGDSNLEDMTDIVETVDATKNLTKTADNLKISVSKTVKSTTFTWEHSFNGADYGGLVIRFINGSFSGLSDKRSIYKIGSTDVTISKEEAKILSYKYVENLTWTVGNEQVTSFNIVNEGTDPELLTRGKENASTLYPYWYVLLYLDALYPGNVRHIQVMLWADTGELIACQPLSFGGGASVSTVENEASTEQSTSLLDTQNEGILPSNFAPILAIVTTTLIIFSVATILFKRKHK